MSNHAADTPRGFIFSVGKFDVIVAIHQPEFIPWPGFLNKMCLADIYIVLDDVQFAKGNWQNRNRIFSRDQGETLLTVPVQSTGSLETQIRDIRLSYHDGGKWQRKNWRILQANYSNHAFFEVYKHDMERLLRREAEFLIDYNFAFIDWFRSVLGISTPLVRSSSLGVEGRRTDKLVEIVRSINGTTYLSGSGGRNYLSVERFLESGIELKFQKFSPPSYPGNTEGNVRSTIDLLLSVGPEKASKLIREGSAI